MCRKVKPFKFVFVLFCFSDKGTRAKNRYTFSSFQKARFFCITDIDSDSFVFSVSELAKTNIKKRMSKHMLSKHTTAGSGRMCFYQSNRAHQKDVNVQRKVQPSVPLMLGGQNSVEMNRLQLVCTASHAMKDLLTSGVHQLVCVCACVRMRTCVCAMCVCVRV